MVLPDHSQQRKHLTIIGLGNEMLSDDGLGLRVVRELRKRLMDHSAEFVELSVGGLQLFDYLIGTDEYIIVDAIATGTQPAGTMLRFVQTPDHEPVKLTSSHQIDLGQILGLAKFMGADLPRRLTVYGIEAEDITTFREKCTPHVMHAIPLLADAICEDLRSAQTSSSPCIDKWQILSEPVTP